MGDGATCAWGMTPEQVRDWNERAEACGFASVEQQEGLAKLYDALHRALVARYSMESERTSAFERDVRSHSGDWTLAQDAQRVALAYKMVCAVRWGYDGEVSGIETFDEHTPFEVTLVIADSLSRLGRLT